MTARIYSGDSAVEEEGTKAVLFVTGGKVTETTAAAYALVVLGDELAPRVLDGQTVVVDAELPQTGDLALVQTNASDAPALRLLGAFDPRWLGAPIGDCEPMIELILLSPVRTSEFFPVSTISVLRRARVVP